MSGAVAIAVCILQAAALAVAQQTATIPDFVTKYAPLVYLDQNEVYLPSDLQLHLNHTTPYLNLTTIKASQLPDLLLLSDLDQLNPLDACKSFSGCDIYLTSKDNITANPPWLYGVLPDPVTLKSTGAVSCAVIVNDHGDGTVDAFYHYFYSFNYGSMVYGQVLGNHVGDWEYSMMRFINGTPISIWLSQHESGQALTYTTLLKRGLRPLIFSAFGSHANFAVPGTHSRNIAGIIVNDYTSPGPLWDPILSSFSYSYMPSPSTRPQLFPNSSSTLLSVNGTFLGVSADTPIAWLYYYGRWGDAQYPDSDPRQVNFLNLSVSWKYESGPTGPLDKGLERIDVCPDVWGSACVTTTQLPAVSGNSIPVTVTRPSFSATGRPATTTGGATGTGSSSGVASPTGKSAAGRRAGFEGWVVGGLMAVLFALFVS